MKPTSTENNDLTTYCKGEYATDNPTLNIIREFEQDYSASCAAT
jgi:hypothetical protein